MKRRPATVLAAAVVLAVGAAIAPSAFASSNFAVSVSVPGFAAGYTNSGAGFVAAAPVPFYAPVVTYPAPVVVTPYYRPYVRPFVAAPYFYRAPVRIGYYGHSHW